MTGCHQCTHKENSFSPSIISVCTNDTLTEGKIYKRKEKEKDLIYERKRNGDNILEITYFPHWGTVVEELKKGARTNCRRRFLL